MIINSTGTMKGSQINCRPFIILIFIAMVMMVFAEAYPASYPGYYPPAGLEEQNYNYANLQQAIERIREAFLQNNEIENSKRGIDFGLNRGYSAGQAAKHKMGIAAANFAGGPGRKRRSDDFA